MIEYRHIKGHVEVYEDGKFLFAADSEKEADEELNQVN